MRKQISISIVLIALAACTANETTAKVSRLLEFLPPGYKSFEFSEEEGGDTTSFSAAYEELSEEAFHEFYERFAKDKNWTSLTEFDESGAPFTSVNFNKGDEFFSASLMKIGR